MTKKHALITGGGSGIGLATAQRLASNGYRITVSGRNQKQLETSGFDFVTFDVSQEDQVNEAFEKIGPIDVLVSNAGSAQTAPALSTPLALWQNMLNINLTGAFLCAKAGLPGMIDRGWGRFIVIASTSSLKGYPYTAAYCASKHGVLGLVRTLAIELAKTGVTSNAVCPGFTQTELLDRSIENIVKTTKLDHTQARKALLKDNPMHRPITPEEVAASVAFLASEHAGSTNGQSIVVDGGELIS